MREFIKRVIGTHQETRSHIENVLGILDRNIRAFRPSNMLDVGSGDGTRTLLVAKYFNIPPDNVHGVDSDEDLIRDTGRLFHVERIDLEEGALPYGDGFFDLVMCNQILEHLKNFRQVIREMIRVTRSGGYMVIGIPNLAHLVNRIYLLFGIQPMCIHLNGPHVRGYAHRAFLALLNSMTQVRVLDCTGALMYPLPLLFSKYLCRYFVGLSGYTCYLLQRRK